MKTFLIPLAASAGLLAFTANAQQLGPDDSFESEFAKRANEAAFGLQQPKANEITIGKFTYSGIFIQALKTDNPLQLVNPFAPPKYGSPEDNVVRDPIKKKVVGLKLFAIEF